MGDGGIVIVDDDITIDQEKVNEERRAYLEEARSQEAFDQECLSVLMTYPFHESIMSYYG